MRIYFSGGRGLTTTPEGLVPQRRPHIMLTFYDIDQNGTRDRLKSFLRNQKSNEDKSRKVSKRTGVG